MASEGLFESGRVSLRVIFVAARIKLALLQVRDDDQLRDTFDLQFILPKAAVFLALEGHAVESVIIIRMHQQCNINIESIGRMVGFLTEDPRINSDLDTWLWQEILDVESGRAWRGVPSTDLFS